MPEHETALLRVTLKRDTLEASECLMDAHLLTLRCEPEAHEALEFQLDAPVNVRSGKQYSIRDGIPDFLEMVSGQDKQPQELYDRFTVRVRASFSPTLCTSVPLGRLTAHIRVKPGGRRIGSAPHAPTGFC